MVKKYLFSALLFLPLFCKSQNNGCIDSISFNRFLSPYFGGVLLSPVRDTANNIYINGFTSSGGDSYTLTKFNTNNDLVWFKIYRITPFTQIVPTGLTAVDNKANLILGGAGSPMKFDSAANFLWAKKFKRIDFPALNIFGTLCTDENENVYLYGSYTDDNTKTNIVKLDPSGNIMWSKKYGNTNLPKFHSQEKILLSQENSDMVLFNHFFYDADNYNDPSAKHGLQMVKINKTDGSVMQQKTIMYYNDAAGNNQNYFSLKNINYSKSTHTFLLDSWGQVLPPFFRSHILTLLDDDLNLLNTQLYNSTVINPGENVSISKANEITITLNRPTFIFGFPENRFFFISINNKFNIERQRIINMSNLSFPDYGFTADIAYKKNGILNFQMMFGGLTTLTNNPVYLFDNSPFYQNLNSFCSGKDTIIYTKGNIYAIPVNGVTYSDVADVPLSATNFIPDLPTQQPFPKQEICKELSICDTIKLLGTQYHCLSSPLDSFKIIRNPLCKRVTNWQVDTTYIKILNQNDTALYVQYRQPYRGKIKVSFGGCSLTDSIAIEVYAAQTGVYLGNDTMHCPGKTITLKASKNFKTYLWQDGSSKDSLVAAQPGSYNITATDSCGNIFKDTLLINPFDVVLKADYHLPICPADTAKITLPNQLYNYSWLPTTAATLNNFTWRLFPATTTTYRITGERLPGCTVSDTVLINVKPICIPDYIYWPNAFTPDNNGRNDTYKPAINGQLVLYEFIIYNRYGQAVFKTSNPTQGWDGRFKNSPQGTVGKPLAGGYVWSCKYQFAGKLLQQEQGTFVLIR